MAVQVHSPRGICAAARRSRCPSPRRLPVGARPGGAGSGGPVQAGPALKAHGLAVWVTPGAGQDIDDAVMARAAELLLARALKIAPEAEVRVWPAAGAATSAAPPLPQGDRREHPAAEPGCRRRPLRRTPRSTDDGGAHPAAAVGRSRQPGVRGPGRRRGAAGRAAGAADRRRIQAAALPRGELLPHRRPGGTAIVPRIVRFPRARPPGPSTCTWAGCGASCGAGGTRSPRSAAAATSLCPDPAPRCAGPAEYSI